MATSKDNSLGFPLGVLALLVASYLFKPLLAIGLALIALAIIAGLCFIIWLFISSHFANKQFTKEYKAFLNRVDGSCFFFYNSRKNSVSFARETVVPLLEPTVKVVFVDGEDIDVGDDSRFVSHMLYEVKHKKGFPYLIKIDNEEPVDYSVNNIFYNTMNGKKELEPLLKRISEFYNSSTVLE